MGIKFVDLVIPLLLNLLHFSSSENFLRCNGTTLGECSGDNELCNTEKKVCECIHNFTRVGNNCISDEDVPTSNVGTTITVTILALILIVSGVVLVAKKYKLIEYIYDKINSRRNNSPVYEDVMIDRDDPPINL